MPSYRFVTEWRLAAPIDRVFATIENTASWPDWWPMVRRVERLSEGEPGGIGAVDRMTFVGKLPYRLAFDMQVTRNEPPAKLAGDATGELEGTGEWAFWEEDGRTAVRYVWAIRTNRCFSRGGRSRW